MRRGKERCVVLIPTFSPSLTLSLRRSTADSLLADRTFMDSTYKASIIAAAERESSDEEGEEGEAFVEDFDAGGRSFGVRDAGEDEHEESREKESRDVTPAGSGRNTPVVSRVVFLLRHSLISASNSISPPPRHLTAIHCLIPSVLPFRTISRRLTFATRHCSTARVKCGGARRGSCCGRGRG